MKLIAQWRRWQIFLDENSWIAIKKAKDENKIPAINKERQILLKLKEANIDFVPQIIDWWEWRFSYKRIEGITMYDILRKSEEKYEEVWRKITWNTSNNIKISSEFLQSFFRTFQTFKKYLFLDLLQKAYILDKLWIIHWELIRPYKNIILGKSDKFVLKKSEKNSEKFWKNILSDFLWINLSDFPRIHIIDFERWKIWDYSWKNMRSFAQFLLNQWILTLDDVKKLGKLNKDDIFEFLKEKILSFKNPI